MNDVTWGEGTKDDPWLLKTPPGTSEYQAWRDEAADPQALVVQVGKTRLSYQLRCIEDLHAMLLSKYACGFVCGKLGDPIEIGGF